VRLARNVVLPRIGRSSQDVQTDMAVDAIDRFGAFTGEGVLRGISTRRDREPLLSDYEELRLTRPQQRALLAERRRASRDRQLARINAREGGDATTSAADRLSTSDARADEQRASNARPLLQRAGNLAAGVPRFLGEVWRGSEQASRDAAIERYRTLYRLAQSRQANASPEVEEQRRLDAVRAAPAASFDAALSAAELTPMGVASLAASPARALARTGVRAATGRVPRALRPPPVRPQTPVGALTQAGRQFSGDVMSLGATRAFRERPITTAAVVGGGAVAASAAHGENEEGLTLDQRRALALADVRRRRAESGIGDELLSGAAGAGGGAIASALLRRALPRHPLAGATLGAGLGGAAAGAAVSADNRGTGALEGAGGGLAALALYQALRRRASRGRLSAAEAARLAELERQFGPLTAGERSGNAAQRLREDDWRRGMGGDTAARTIRGFDYSRAPQLREGATNIVTRGLPAVSADVGDAGRILSDELRTMQEQRWEVARELYDEAFNLARAEPIPKGINRLPSQSLAEAAEEHMLTVPAEVDGVFVGLDKAIQEGRATHGNVERARQNLQRRRREAANGRRDADEFVYATALDALDGWHLNFAPASKAATQAMRNARAVTREIKTGLGQTARVDVGSGHTGRTDLGGRAIDRMINADLTGEQTIDAALGAGFGSGRGAPGAQALGATRRLATLGTQRIKYTGVAGGDARVPGQISRNLSNTESQALFRADDPLAPGGMRQPVRDLQALREGAWHKVLRPLDEYLGRAMEHGVREAGFLPVQRLITNLDNALNHGGREIMEQIYTPRELEQMRGLVEYLRRLVPPPGAAVSGTAPGLMRAFRDGVRFLVRLIPVIGPIVDNVLALTGGVLSEAGSASAAKRAIRPIDLSRLPRKRAPAIVGAAGAGAGVGALAMAGESRAQTRELDEARAEVQRLSAAAELFSSVDPNDPASVRRAQQALQARGLYVADDGRLGRETAAAIREHREQVRAELEVAQRHLIQLEEAERTRRILPSPEEEGRRELLLGLSALAGGALGVLPRLGHVLGNSRRIKLQNRALANRFPNPRALPRLPAIPNGTIGERLAAAEQRDAIRADAIARQEAVNRFWVEGGAGQRVPFASANTARGFKPNPRAAETSQLFPPGGDDLRIDAGYGAVGLGEAAWAQSQLPAAREELRKAQEAVDEDKSEYNLTRLRRAQDAVFRWELALRGGLGFAGGVALAPLKLHRSYPRPTAVIERAGQERAFLNQYLSPRGR
jgi:hypothetical protein